MNISPLLTLLFWLLRLTTDSGVDANSTSTKTRLPENISAHNPTILPIPTSDGHRLYFDRKGHPQNTGGVDDYDDIWYADRLPNGAFGKPVNAGAPLNTPGSDVLCSLAPDDAMALVYGKYDSAAVGVKYPGFSMSFRRNGVWSHPQEIQIDKFANRAKRYYAHLAPDNRTMILALERDSTVGGLDLYVSFRRDTTLSWTEPMHLGVGINTNTYEGSPFLAADNKTLYFSSEGHGGLGAADLFVSRRLDDTWKNWSTPINLGSGINSSEEDSSIDVLLNGRDIYYVSSDSINGKGIYTAQLPDSVQPGASVLLSGTVSLHSSALASLKLSAKSTNQHTAQETPVLVTAYTISSTNTAALTPTFAPTFAPTLVALSQSAIPNARYALAVPAGALYLIRAEAPHSSFPAAFTVLDARIHARFEQRTHNFVLGQSAFPQKISMLTFEQDDALIRPEQYPALTAAALTLKQVSEKNIKLDIIGHTCDIGSEASNNDLSEQRAEAAAQALERMGITRAIMRISGKGKRQPLVRSSSEEARKQNRRVEIILTNR